MASVAVLRALPRRPVLVDVFLAASVSLPGLVALPWSSPGISASVARTIGAIAMLAVAGAVVFARRRWPFGAAAAGAVTLVVAVEAGSFDPNGSSVDGALVTIGLLLWAVVMSFTLGTCRPIRVPLVGVVLVVVAQQWHGVNPFPAVLAIGSYAVGWIVRSRQDLAAALDVRAVELAAEQQRYATEAVRFERARIARELHDVVAHCMSIVVVQASAGQRLPHTDPTHTAATDQILDNIAELTRQAESDLDGLTRLLSREAQPAPALSRGLIDQLVARAISAGTPVQVNVVGDLATIPSLAASALGRVLQEGLTNAIKHAPGAYVAVRVRTDDWLTSIEIENGAARATSEQLGVPSGGNGLRGLRDRVTTLAGTLSGSPTASGGWRLTAVIPATDAVAGPPPADRSLDRCSPIELLAVGRREAGGLRLG